jgi:light-regulated signal transduction histidine kinase (bacteriophytochrome)
MEGYVTSGFSSANQALEALRPGEVDLLLTDLMMPEMDGISLLRAARAVDEDLAGVVMTGHGTIDTAVKAMQDGALDYILKPFKLSTVVSVIGKALEVRRLRLENAAMREREHMYIAELEAANRDLESFTYSVSHDLRAPLRAITGFSALYLEQYGEGVDSGGKRLLNHINEGAARMDQLIEDLLRFCRFSRQPLLKVRVPLHQIIDNARKHLQIQGNGRSIDWRIAPLPTCSVDASLLEQVFVNLLSNAIKFTRDRNPAVIEVGCRQSENFVEIVVRDNGAGFDMNYADKLFGVFQRLHSATQFEGTGVGLSIVQRIIQKHGGTIRAESVVGEGATFVFTLPR